MSNTEPSLGDTVCCRDRKDFSPLSSTSEIAAWTLHQHPDIMRKGQPPLFSDFHILSIYSTEIKQLSETCFAVQTSFSLNFHSVKL